MKYKINEVSRITGIPADNLRYYEKIGVVSPKIDEKNRYRYYEAWDINYIFDYQIYRKLEFSSKQALRFIHEAALPEQLHMLDLRAKYYQGKIDHYRRLQERNEDILRKVRALPRTTDRITIERTPAYRYICYRENYKFFGFEQYMEELHRWFQNIEMTENAVIIPRKVMTERSANNYLWSLLVEENDFEHLSLLETDNVEVIESSLCVSMTVEAGGEGTFHYSLLDPAMEYIQKHRFRLAGDPFGILLIRSHDEAGMHRFFQFYLPIED